MLDNVLQNNVEFYDEEDQSVWGFNRLDFFNLLVNILIRFEGLSESRAHAVVCSSGLFDDKVLSSFDIFSYSRETIWHWAMLSLHGDMYWSKERRLLKPPSNYENWEAEWLKDHGEGPSIFYYK